MAAVEQAGRDLGLAHFGVYALESLRLEKCYRSWKADLAIDYSPLSAALERFVRLDKPAHSSAGRRCGARPRRLRERFVPLLVEAADADASPVSVIYRGRAVVGLVTSGGYGHRLNRSIALGYVETRLPCREHSWRWRFSASDAQLWWRASRSTIRRTCASGAEAARAMAQRRQA